jgi:hypothetical protein
MRIVSQGGDPPDFSQKPRLDLTDLLASDYRSQVELYAKTAPSTDSTIAFVTTHSTPLSLDPTGLSCTLTDLTTCDAAVAALASAWKSSSSGVSNSLPTEASYVTGPMPDGWVVGNVQTEPVSDQ